MASTFFGIVLGFVAIFGGFFLEDGNVDTLFMLPAVLIVVGGTLAAGLAGSSFSQIAKMPRLILLTFNPPEYDREKILKQIVEYSIIAKKQGLLAIESKLKLIENKYLRKFFKICIDGVSTEEFISLVDTEVDNLSRRHAENSDFFVKLGGYAPTMGIIGTVVGLISTLSSAGSDPNELIRHIASAFIATLWGIVTANMIWLPIGDKLKRIHNEEIALIQTMRDGVCAIIKGDNPSIIRSKLLAAFPLEEQERLAAPRKNSKAANAPVAALKLKADNSESNSKKPGNTNGK